MNNAIYPFIALIIGIMSLVIPFIILTKNTNN